MTLPIVVGVFFILYLVFLFFLHIVGMFRQDYIVDGTVIKCKDEVRKERKKASRIRNERIVYNRKSRLLNIGIIGLSVYALLFLHLSNNISVLRTNCSTLEQEISNIKEENKSTRARINTYSNNYGQIREIAYGLGMSEAQPGQIIYYDFSDNDTLVQYQNIP